ncbi:hypothetical protein F511_11755 [Dorcoceras hygrometricum]|uniref:Uncharacterized protein n=1 Tax=Dorcoceras hygrometricum TaxID=472368 RepID=A0A2Z7BXU7_9LAMI|nr:hypothetical protein F511_11755 [Dorcoceras hygrometricum]
MNSSSLLNLLLYDVASPRAISSHLLNMMTSPMTSSALIHLLNMNTTSLQLLRFSSSAECDDIKADVITAHSKTSASSHLLNLHLLNTVAPAELLRSPSTLQLQLAILRSFLRGDSDLHHLLVLFAPAGLTWAYARLRTADSTLDVSIANSTADSMNTKPTADRQYSEPTAGHIGAAADRLLC